MERMERKPPTLSPDPRSLEKLVIIAILKGIETVYFSE